MDSKIFGVDNHTQSAWSNELRQYGIKVSPDTAIFYEMEEFCPSYLFVVVPQSDDPAVGGTLQPYGKIAFYTRNDAPFFPVGNKNRWFEIEPTNVAFAWHKIQDIMASQDVREGQTGYIIPLQESSFFETIEDVNAYLHNLMFWESLLRVEECGPLVQRISFLMHKLYQMRNEQRDAIEMLNKHGIDTLFIDEDNTKVITEAAIEDYERRLKELSKVQKFDRTDRQRELEEKYREFEDLLERSEKEMQESAYRYELMRKQMDELQARMRCEDERNIERKVEYRTMGEKIRSFIMELLEEDNE